MELNKLRKITNQEKVLLSYLITSANYQIENNWEEKIRVKPLDDGNMGSLELMLNNDFEDDRVFGEQIAECYFFDTDDTKVIVSLNVDDNGNLYELDMWKTDFSPLIKVPSDVNLFFKEDV